MIQENNQTLFQGWLAIEREAGRKTGEILADLNSAAGTNYKHNWPSMVASRGYEMERCPLMVRRYMMRKVLAKKLGSLNEAEIDLLVNSLT
jgi:hypothetical protein